MYIIATASADTYITNKIVDGSRTEDSNVGKAGTLDLFKLYGETLSGSTDDHTELSRLLIKFDLSKIFSIASSSFDVNSNDFKAHLRLQSIQTNLPVPSNFTVSVFPLAKEFSEGNGRDVAGYTDIDYANYLKASANVNWNVSGAYASGAVGDSNIDYYASGNLNDGLGLRLIESKQTFQIGNEDLFVDVTDIVSATIGNIIPNYGFLLSFTSSQEQDQTTRFVKRFASRHSINEILRPRLEIHDNTYLFDSHADSLFDVSGTLYLKNNIRGNKANLLSSSIEVSGDNCIHLVLSTGSYENVVTASQFKVGSNFIDGTYKADYYISAQDTSIVSGTTTLSDHLAASGSIIFSEKWKSLDNSITFYDSYLTCSLPLRSGLNTKPRKLILKATNSSKSYEKDSNYKIRVFSYDPDYEPSASRFVKPTKSVVTEAYFSVKDIEGNVIIPFEKKNNGTRMSYDENGMFFDLYTFGFPSGRLMSFEYLVIDRDSEYVVEDKNVKFVVE